MYTLLQNATHLVQPADFGLFGQMKKSWYKEVPQFTQRNPNTGINKKNFFSVFKATWEEVMSSSVLVSAFRKSGIYPLDRKQISNEQLLCSEQSSSETGFLQLRVPLSNSSSLAVQAFEALEAHEASGPPKCKNRQSMTACSLLRMCYYSVVNCPGAATRTLETRSLKNLNPRSFNSFAHRNIT